MSELKHTPGDWVAVPTGRRMSEDYSQPFGVAVNGKLILVAGCFGDIPGGAEVAEANARLIAASPAMLVALKAALSLIETSDFATGVCCCGDAVEGHSYTSGHGPVDQGHYYADQTAKTVRAAIAAATGDQK